MRKRVRRYLGERCICTRTDFTAECEQERQKLHVHNVTATQCSYGSMATLWQLTYVLLSKHKRYVNHV